MRYFDWSPEKNELLKRERGIGFEEILEIIEEGRVLDIMQNPNKKLYPHQKIFVVEINAYAYLVPFVEDAERIFLKTIIPSRKATQKYIINKQVI